MSEKINQNRRRFLANTAMTLAAAELGVIGLVKAQPAQSSNRGGVGHNLPQEAPGAFAEAIVEVDSY